MIAGAGSIKTFEHENVHLWNYWLTEAEIEFLLSESSIVIFPYLEASQSGVIPLAVKKNKIILATKVGGLEEQLEGYEKKVLVNPCDENELIKGIKECIRIAKNPMYLGENHDTSISQALGNQILKVLFEEGVM